MVRYGWDIPKVDFGLGGTKKKKRKTLTPAQRIYFWERPNQYGRTCSICHQRISKLSDLELDHTKAHSKGGTKLALAHKECNRLKGSGSLMEIQKKLGIKSKKRRSTKRNTKKRLKKSNPYELKIPKFKIPKII